jgi:8-oxo-dGTP diphosphatase
MRKSRINEEEKNIPTHVVAVFAFVEKNGKILLAKRSKDDPQVGGQWSFPGGKVELDEGENILLKTLKKEIREEVGIVIEDDIRLISDDGFYRVSGHHVVGLTFLCRWKSGVAKPLEDHDEVRWFSCRELKEYADFPDYLRKRIDKLLKISKE